MNVEANTVESSGADQWSKPAARWAEKVVPPLVVVAISVAGVLASFMQPRRGRSKLRLSSIPAVPEVQPMSCKRALLPAVLIAAAAAVQAQGPYVNETAGGPLRAGVYGRIKVSGAAPPALISPRPVVAIKELGPVRGEPLYLYLPPGQVRKWSQYCARYDACERPVYFVRIDGNPGKLGRWKTRAKLDRLPQRDAMRVAGGDPRL